MRDWLASCRRDLNRRRDAASSRLPNLWFSLAFPQSTVLILHRATQLRYSGIFRNFSTSPTFPRASMCPGRRVSVLFSHQRIKDAIGTVTSSSRDTAFTVIPFTKRSNRELWLTAPRFRRVLSLSTRSRMSRAMYTSAVPPHEILQRAGYERFPVCSSLDSPFVRRRSFSGISPLT